jgi:hypothetical protein
LLTNGPLQVGDPRDLLMAVRLAHLIFSDNCASMVTGLTTQRFPSFCFVLR